MVAKTIVDYNNYVSHGFVAENEEQIMSSQKREVWPKSDQ